MPSDPARRRLIEHVSFSLRDSVFLGCVLLTLTILAVAFSTYEQHNAYSDYCQASAHAKNEACRFDKPFMEMFFHDPTALFTGVLTFFTGLLFIATCGLWYMAVAQGRDLKVSVEAATKSADVAERVLTGVERPYLFAKIEGDPRLVQFILTDDFHRILFYIENFGKTPAIITFMKAELVIAHLNEAVEGYGFAGFEPTAHTVIAASDKTGLFEAPIKGITQVDSMSLIAGTKRLVLHGEVSYIDMLGTPHETDFCFEYRRGKGMAMSAEGNSHT